MSTKSIHNHKRYSNNDQIINYQQCSEHGPRLIVASIVESFSDSSPILAQIQKSKHIHSHCMLSNCFVVCFKNEKKSGIDDDDNHSCVCVLRRVSERSIMIATFATIRCAAPPFT